MGNNNFTETFQDGTALTQTQLETALQSLTLDISNTSQMTTGSTSGQYLKSVGSGSAAVFADLPTDPTGLNDLKNYGLSVSASVGALSVALKTNAGSNPASNDKVTFQFSSNGSSSATYSSVDVTSVLSLTITASATLGFTATSTNRVYVYAINNAGTARLAVSGRSDLDVGAAVTTVAMSSSADSIYPLYATAALTVAVRLLGWFEAAHTSGGAWQAPTKVNITNNSDLSNKQIQVSSSAIAVGGIAISPSCSSFSVNSASYTDVTNLSVTLTTRGRPVRVELIPDGSGVAGFQDNGSGVFVKLLRGSTAVAEIGLQSFSSSLTNIHCPPSSMQAIDPVAAGTYTYKVQIKNGGSNSVTADRMKLVAYEMPQF